MSKENKYTQIIFKAKVEPVKPVNSEFELCKVYVQGIGKNRNGSYMSKENVQKYSDTLNYCPVVGHIIEATDPSTGEKHRYMGGHDYAFDENWEVVDLTVPYGVVVNDSFDFEIVNEYGTDVEYMTAQVILWTGRYPILKDAIYSDDFYFNQSMEINPIQYRTLEEDSNYIEILEWSYSALCLLGKADDKNSPEHTEPCFISSSVIPIKFEKSEFEYEMKELKEKLSFCFKNNSEEKGGIVNLDKKLEILQKFNKTIDDLDFSIEDMSVEDLNAKMEELFGEKEPKAEPIAFSATYKEKRQALQNALDPIIVKDAEGNYVEETYFYIEDFSDEYVFVEKDHWTASDYDCKYGRFAYTFDETTHIATITGEFEEMVKVWLTIDEKSKLDEERANYETKYSELEREFSDYKADHSYFNSEFEELKEYRNSKEAEERDTAEKTIFKKYEKKIGETNEFSELKKNASNYSIKDLEKECLYIVGLYSFANEPKQNTETPVDNSIKFSATHDNGEIEDPIEATYKKYLNK